MITKTSIDTIKALAELAKLPEGKAEGVSYIAQRIKAPQNYLGKTLQRLVKEGIVKSQKGLNGGFRLAKAAKDIRLYEIVSTLEDFSRWEGCFMGNGQCGGGKNGMCVMHNRWKIVRESYIDFLKNTSIADI
jgi:Rrf2 family iron-sulfur cluster assembly transcriptional regulator